MRMHVIPHKLIGGGHVTNERLVSKETVVPRRRGSETLKFRIKQVDMSKKFST